MIKIVPVEGHHVTHVAEHMSSESRDEVWAASGLSPLNALRSSLDTFDGEAFAVLPIVDGKESDPVAIFGSVPCPFTKGVGIMWMLTTEMLLTTSQDIVEQAPDWFNNWLCTYPKGLHNVIDARNAGQIQWLGEMGCRFDKQAQLVTTPEGITVPFIHFSYVPKIQLAA